MSSTAHFAMQAYYNSTGCPTMEMPIALLGSTQVASCVESCSESLASSPFNTWSSVQTSCVKNIETAANETYARTDPSHFFRYNVEFYDPTCTHMKAIGVYPIAFMNQCVPWFFDGQAKSARFMSYKGIRYILRWEDDRCAGDKNVLEIVTTYGPHPDGTECLKVNDYTSVKMSYTN